MRFFAKNDFSFQFRARASRQGGFAPLKSPDWGQSPQTPTIFYCILDASWCPESCAKKWARYLKRFKSCIVSKFLSWFRSALYFLVNTFFHSWKIGWWETQALPQMIFLKIFRNFVTKKSVLKHFYFGNGSTQGHFKIMYMNKYICSYT